MEAGIRTIKHPSKDNFIFYTYQLQWATKRYALPTGTNRIRFKAISAYGNNLYLDNCSIGSQLSVDVGVQSVDMTNPTLAQTSDS
jgi:hypothetical protein